MSRGANWAKGSATNNRKKAMKATKQLKCDRKGKTFKLVKVSDSPPTWKEVEIKESV